MRHIWDFSHGRMVCFIACSDYTEKLGKPVSKISVGSYDSAYQNEHYSGSKNIKLFHIIWSILYDVRYQIFVHTVCIRFSLTENYQRDHYFGRLENKKNRRLTWIFCFVFVMFLMFFMVRVT